MITTAQLNGDQKVHNWYVFPEAYSPHLIDKYAEKFGLPQKAKMLDPFCGTGTSIISAKFKGMEGVGVDANPFAVFVSNTKADWTADPKILKTELNDIIAQLRIPMLALAGPNSLQRYSSDEECAEAITSLTAPEMPKLDLWISPRVINKVLLIKERILEVKNKRIQRLLLLALAAILRESSNMKLAPHAFGSRTIKEDAPVLEAFEKKVNAMVNDLYAVRATEREGTAMAFVGDSRELNAVLDGYPNGYFDLAITSPPYVNNLDYTMQTRLELFFLDFVKDMEELKSIRKRFVTCDAKGIYKGCDDSKLVRKFGSIQAISDKLEEKMQGKKWGWNYPKLVTEYFGGMYRVMEATRPFLKDASNFVLVVGESSHMGVKVAVPDILGEIAGEIGYSISEIETLRERRCSSHEFRLKEAAVVITK